MRQHLLPIAVLSLVVRPVEVWANYALFTQPTDTISLNGNTVLDSAATYEARIQLRGAGGKIFNEWRNKEEDKSLSVTGNSLSAYSYEINRPEGIFAYPIITQYQWHHVAYVYDGEEERLYLDGELLSQRVASGNIRDAALSISSIGCILRDGLSTSFIGLLDTFRVSSVARYAGASFAPPQGDLVADADTELLFNFTEPSDSFTVTDLSPNGFTGFLGAGFTGATAPSLISTLPLAGDLDYDGFVGLTDLDMVLAHWNENAGPGYPQVGDLTGDGYVGLDDLDIVLSNWNAGTPPADVIPEPAGVGFVLLSLYVVGRPRC